MIIRKFLHSCILIEEGGKRLLVDPGAYSFIEKKITPEDIGRVDAVLVTHKHGDHFDPDALRRIGAPITTHREIGLELQQGGGTYHEVKAGEWRELAGFRVRALECAHEPLPEGVPYNLAYFINNRLWHPGDSLRLPDEPKQVEILCLPVAAPWGTISAMLDFAKAFHPKHVIPIHDGFVKDFMLERIYERCNRILGEAGIAFHPLKLGEKLEL